MSLYQRYADQGVEVWGIASFESTETLTRFRDAYGITFPILVDADGAVSDVYNQLMAFPSAAYPQDWIVGTDGRVVYVNNAFELSEMVTVIEAELAGG